MWNILKSKISFNQMEKEEIIQQAAWKERQLSINLYPFFVFSSLNSLLLKGFQFFDKDNNVFFLTKSGKRIVINNSFFKNFNFAKILIKVCKSLERIHLYGYSFNGKLTFQDIYHSVSLS